jgi:hypothetical protein
MTFVRNCTDEERFWPKVIKLDSCWIWVGAKNRKGYGQFSVSGRSRSAHRWSYEQANGYVSSGLVLDHLCRVPSCVRPDHMEPVTNAENIRRGSGISVRRAAQTHCTHGHQFTEENTYRNKRGNRHCRTCAIDSAKRRYAANPEMIKTYVRDYKRRKMGYVIEAPTWAKLATSLE